MSMKIVFSRKVMLTELVVPILLEGKPEISTTHVFWYLAPTYEAGEVVGLSCCLSSVRLPAYPEVTLTDNQKEDVVSLLREYHKADFDTLNSAYSLSDPEASTDETIN